MDWYLPLFKNSCGSLIIENKFFYSFTILAHVMIM